MPRQPLITEKQALEALKLVKEDNLSVAKAAAELKVPKGSVVNYFRSIGFSPEAHRLEQSRKKAHSLIGKTVGYVKILKILNPEASASNVQYEAECTYGGKGCKGKYIFNYAVYGSAITKGRKKTLSCGCYGLEATKKRAGSLYW